MWAVGCIGYELCLGRKLAENNDALEEYIVAVEGDSKAINTLLASIPQRFGSPVHEIIRECLKWDPRRRCSAEEVRDYLSTIYQRPGENGPASPVSI